MTIFLWSLDHCNYLILIDAVWRMIKIIVNHLCLCIEVRDVVYSVTNYLVIGFREVTKC